MEHSSQCFRAHRSIQKIRWQKCDAKRDKYLVMAADEEGLFKLVAATTFAIQTKPRRLELDLWKSFVNVDIKFLEGLDNKWLE